MTPQQNEQLCRVEGAAPMGKVMRRHWLPVCMSEEVAEPDGAPRRARLLGVDLVVFRDTQGRVGVLDELSRSQSALSIVRKPYERYSSSGEINTQVDVIDWRGSRGFVGEGAALGRLVAHLAARRTSVVNAESPTGILTHHLVHDTATWRFLENLQDWLARRGGLELFQDPRQMWAMSA